MTSSFTRAIALACILGIAVAACGDDEDGETAATTAGAPATGASPDTTSPPTSARSIDATAATAGTTAVAGDGDPSGIGTATLLPGGPFGNDGAKPALFRGAGGFAIDLAECPSDYDVNQGITDTEITLATSVPRSGPLAGFGLVADGMTSYFTYVNEQHDGIDGRQIVLDVKDDAYEPARTKSNVDEMVQSGDYAAFASIVGTANALSVWDDLNEECMPNILTASGAAQWGDVENHPWTTGPLLNYFSEAQIWAEWIKTEFPDGATVAALTFNNDFGQSYTNGFKSAIEGSNIELVAEELHEAAAPNLANQFTSLAASNADVLLLQTTGSFCTQGMSEVDKGAWKPKVMMSTTCGSLGQFFQPLVDQGLTGQGTYIVQYVKDVNDAANAGDPFVKLFKETVEGQGLDPAQSTYATGWIYAWYTVEILKLAATLDGGLSRPNIMIAHRSFEASMPLFLDGLTGRMEGLEDAYLTEGGQIVQYTVTDPNQLGSYQPVSEIINNEGELGTYAAVQAAQG